MQMINVSSFLMKFRRHGRSPILCSRIWRCATSYWHFSKLCVTCMIHQLLCLIYMLFALLINAGFSEENVYQIYFSNLFEQMTWLGGRFSCGCPPNDHLSPRELATILPRTLSPVILVQWMLMVGRHIVLRPHHSLHKYIVLVDDHFNARVWGISLISCNFYPLWTTFWWWISVQCCNRFPMSVVVWNFYQTF